MERPVNLQDPGEVRDGYTAYEYNIMTTHCIEQGIDSIKDASNDEESFDMAYIMQLVHDLLPFHKIGIRLNKVHCQKTAEASMAHCYEGNRAYKENNFHEALSSYHKCIAFAPFHADANINSVPLAMGFANRSAVFFKLAKYEECLSDIEQTLKLLYPEGRKHKVIYRRGECFWHMGMMEEAKQSFKEAQDHLPIATEESAAIAARASSIAHYLRAIELGRKPFKAYHTRSSRLRPPVQLSYGVNEEVPSASNSVRLVYSINWGRHYKSNFAIPAGRIVLIEEPYLTTMNLLLSTRHCFKCLEQRDFLIPCKTCHLVMYCSEECREISWEQTHELECPFIQMLAAISQYEPVTAAALRILIMALKEHGGVRGLYKHVHQLEMNTVNPLTSGFNSKRQLISNSYDALHFLKRNSVQRSARDLYLHATKATILVNCVESFSDLLIDESSGIDYSRFAGGLLLRYAQIVALNGYAVIKGSSEQYVGRGLNVAASFINHSCIPNVCVHHRGEKLIFMTSLPIEKGEQLFINYTSEPSVLEVEGRNEKLQRQYFFTCKCKSCLGIWPESTVEMSDLIRKCPMCKIETPSWVPSGVNLICTSCSFELNMPDTSVTVAQAVIRLDEMWKKVLERKDLTSDISEEVGTLHTLLKIPRDMIIRYQDMLVANNTQDGNYYLTNE